VSLQNNADSNLVSNNNVNQKIPSSGWDPGPGNLSHNGLTPDFFLGKLEDMPCLSRV